MSKIVTVCQGGNVRSVGLKFLLTYGDLGISHDVIACGWESNTEETRDMLFSWADYIIILESKFEQYTPEKHKNKEDGSRKLFCYDVGPDNYGYAFHPDLQKKLRGMVVSHGLLLKAK